MSDMQARICLTSVLFINPSNVVNWDSDVSGTQRREISPLREGVGEIDRDLMVCVLEQARVFSDGADEEVQ